MANTNKTAYVVSTHDDDDDDDDININNNNIQNFTQLYMCVFVCIIKVIYLLIRSNFTVIATVNRTALHTIIINYSTVYLLQPSHPSERPTCVPRLPAQMPNSPSHVSAQQTTPRMSREASSHQPPPVYNPPPQYTRTYIQKQPTGDKGNTMGHGPPDNAVQQTGSTTSLHQVCNNTTYFPNSSRASNQR